MRTLLLGFVIASMLAFNAQSGPAANKPNIPKLIYDRTPQRLERGKYLVEGLAHCFRCHSENDFQHSNPTTMHRTPSAPIGGRFTPASKAAPPPPPLDYDHQPTTAYPIPDLPDFNAPPASLGNNYGSMANVIPDTTRVADIPAELLQAAARPVATPVPRTRSGPDEEHFHEVYLDFVAQRERCGESADGLTYERFATKLRKNRDQLISKYSCRTVRFQVYVKDGKAALKATPVKD